MVSFASLVLGVLGGASFACAGYARRHHIRRKEREAHSLIQHRLNAISEARPPRRSSESLPGPYLVSGRSQTTH